MKTRQTGFYKTTPKKLSPLPDLAWLSSESCVPSMERARMLEPSRHELSKRTGLRGSPLCLAYDGQKGVVTIGTNALTENLSILNVRTERSHVLSLGAPVASLVSS